MVLTSSRTGRSPTRCKKSVSPGFRICVGDGREELGGHPSGQERTVAGSNPGLAFKMLPFPQQLLILTASSLDDLCQLDCFYLNVIKCPGNWRMLVGPFDQT